MYMYHNIAYANHNITYKDKKCFAFHLKGNRRKLKGYRPIMVRNLNYTTDKFALKNFFSTNVKWFNFL
jgi:hypothetical protein